MRIWWPLKIVVKLSLSWIPDRHKILRNLGIFKHGKMDEVAHAHKLFTLHAKDAFPNGLPQNFTVLELGPGDSLLSALVAKSYGASKIYMADAGSYASTDIKLYKQAAKDLKNNYNLNVPDISKIGNIDDFLNICNATYLTNGLSDLSHIPSQSIDFIWSHSVVEHIRKKDFAPTMQQLARILKKDGVVSHNVDLQDHLDKSLNNLRFPERFWENDFVAKAGFYTNRIRYSQSLEYMRNAGFEVIHSNTGKWEHIPLQKSKMLPQFQSLPDEELRIRTYNVLLKAA